MSVSAAFRCVPWELRPGRDGAELLASRRSSGRGVPAKGRLITAIALATGLAIVTLTARDFDGSSVSVIDPRSGDPSSGADRDGTNSG